MKSRLREYAGIKPLLIVIITNQYYSLLLFLINTR